MVFVHKYLLSLVTGYDAITNQDIFICLPYKHKTAQSVDNYL